MFPVDLGQQLARATTDSLSNDATSDRWIAVLEALAFSPIRTAVKPLGAPQATTDLAKQLDLGQPQVLDDLVFASGSATLATGDYASLRSLADWLHANPGHLAGDRSLLEELGLRSTGPNVVEFGAAALTRLEAVADEPSLVFEGHLGLAFSIVDQDIITQRPPLQAAAMLAAPWPSSS